MCLQTKGDRLSWCHSRAGDTKNGPKEDTRHSRLVPTNHCHRSTPVPRIYRVLSVLHPNYSKIAQPLLDLTKKTTPWHWDKPQFKAFETLKTLMCRKPVLLQPNFAKRFYLQTDASAYCMGAILSQVAGPHDTPPPKNSKPQVTPVTSY